MLVQTEMERVKYLVRSYVRCRLHKVGPPVLLLLLLLLEPKSVLRGAR